MAEDPTDSDVAGETPEERSARLNFFSDAVRAGLHSAGVDIMEQLTAQHIPDAGACILTGACQFVAELYEETARKAGGDRAKFRQHMLSSIELYFNTYCEMSVKDAVSGDAGRVQ